MAWEEKRIKELGKVVLGKMLCSTFSENMKLKPYLKAKNVYWGELRLDSVEEMYFSDTEIKQYKLEKGDLILTEGGEVGRTAIWNEEFEECYLQNSVHKITLNKKICYPKFYMYLSYTLAHYYDSLVTFISIKHLTSEKLNRIIWVCPPLSEQQRIAEYLDKQTASIDSRIALLEKKKEKYLVLRKAVINEAVTPKEGWKEVRLKDVGYLYSGLSGKSGDDFLQDEDGRNRAFIPFTNIFNNDVINPEVMGHVTIEEGEVQNRVKKGDLFFLMSSEDYDGLGKSSLLNVDLEDTYLNSFCKGFRLINKNTHPEFLNYLLQSFDYRNKMKIEGKGFTRMNLKSEKVSCFSVKLPDIDEQKRLAKIISIKVGQIDTIVSKITDQIENLKVLRKCIINESVREK